jgi:hypothetical protein
LKERYKEGDKLKKDEGEDVESYWINLRKGENTHI